MRRNQQTTRRRRERGVTLIEMMVVVTIIALFSALVLPKMFKRADMARVTAARAQMNGFLTALGTYKLDTSTFPSNEQGLAALRVAPAGVPLWKGPYLPQDVPLDPWGRPYAYKYPGEHGDEPEITSFGADGTPGGDDVNADIFSWKNQ
ncbi:MAG TPA: type II secretion system major pseudopilin GspG [Bryobacteraceae bacterium]|nr:type II secretion system major pseudopilin GspG [Bryobacteraceae bacterium]